ncbi:MAG: type II secretion system protein [Opitutales bacterium]
MILRTAQTPRPRPVQPSRAGFTLVEIMIVVVIIGLLVTMGIPAFQKARVASQNQRFINDLRTISNALETYALQEGLWPDEAGAGVVPTGLGDYLPRGFDWSAKNTLGGDWDYEYGQGSILAAIGTTNVEMRDADGMTAIDEDIDDGDLSTGAFRQNGDAYVYVLEL